GRNWKNGADSTTAGAHRFAGAQLDGNGLCVGIAGSASGRHGLLRLPTGGTEETESWGRDQSESGRDRASAAGCGAGDQTLKYFGYGPLTGCSGDPFLCHRSTKRG